MRLADRFTLTRIILAPIFFVLFLTALWVDTIALPLLIGLVFLLACAELTDFFDGYFARKLNQVSDLGKLLDPFADVILHMTTFFSFTLAGTMPPVIFLLIMYREFTMLFLRLLAVKQGVTIAARKGGKFKTVLYVAACFYSLIFEIIKRMPTLSDAMFSVMPRMGIALYVVCLILCYGSFVDYLISFRSVIRRK
ncbi:MAG: CDP-diacylglycerol--glycerol-3-phosphate 3-phosphatidyltransferase [Spirochaetaceae bacterium]|jgi:CDP-diacylglycerol--glycerol-3-phosphate 3-phosphatidyltransferase|nr:CDP-diacylglycerol--glycerol-3-phosphate 3-phosphatidyltransferase [Spirochaetaceae bacterium]